MCRQLKIPSALPSVPLLKPHYTLIIHIRMNFNNYNHFYDLAIERSRDCFSQTWKFWEDAGFQNWGAERDTWLHSNSLMDFVIALFCDCDLNLYTFLISPLTDLKRKLSIANRKRSEWKHWKQKCSSNERAVVPPALHQNSFHHYFHSLSNKATSFLISYR